MTTLDYDRHLATLALPRDWIGIPQSDYLTFVTFGTIDPRILRMPHLLVESCAQSYTVFRDVFKTAGALLGADVPNIGGQDGRNLSAWIESLMQNRLLATIENLKFESNRNLIVDADLPSHIVDQIRASFVYRGIVGDRVAEKTWFDSLDELLSMISWAYVPLHECTQFDLLVVARGCEERLSLLDERLTTIGLKCGRITRNEERWIWPE